MFQVFRACGGKRREDKPRFESAELPDWLIEVHAREKMLAESRLKAARNIGLNNDMKIIATDENEPSDENEPPE